MSRTFDSPKSLHELAIKIKNWGADLGFQQVAIIKPDLSEASKNLRKWINDGYHGTMDWMNKHGEKRYKIDKLVDQAMRVICFRMDYLTDDKMIAVLRNDDKAYISRYALGRDYHKLIRRRLGELVRRIRQEIPGHNVNQRAFVDSAPVMEKPLAAQAGLGWIGKNTLLLNEKAGSWFFIGEIYTSLELPIDITKSDNLCGNCRACNSICPTNAFPEPYILDARRCISYLTIENKHEIPEDIRPLIGNRVFGCDDCQIICPWNRFPTESKEPDFRPRHNFDDIELLTLFTWNEEEFLFKTRGSAIRRIGYQQWQRNLAVGLGNSQGNTEVLTALKRRFKASSSLVRDHVSWAIKQQREKLGNISD